ncbi:TonB-dependent siderophore receptor [Azospirillum palustre]|uniref:TonB-dependent siderophore receptor n=1 Tax=Azospirillum palustre TaxID=2044885 RepID=A0A2B8BHI8_9PROT|nr:TonB-dependent siderophore receptor [Azospirillum palustre]PGH57189.1 TonB-dependent siderophore receptor [Azospirillum palustre]
MTLSHGQGALLLVGAVLSTGTVSAQDAVQLDPITLYAGDGGAVIDGYRAVTTSSATKTETPLKETPQSVVVVTPQLLRDQGVTTIAEGLKNVSGAQGSALLQTPAYESTILRGFQAEIYRDGITSYLNTGDPNAMAGIERIEVLKGPNAILYGGGVGTPLGGVVNIVTKKPQDRDFATVGLSYGSNGYTEPSFDINRRLSGDGTVLFRMNGSYVRSGSDVDLIKTKRYSFSPSLTFGNGTDTRLTVDGYVSRWSQQEYQALPAWGTVAGDFRLSRDLYIGDPDVPDSHTSTRKVTVTLDHDFNDDWSSKTQFRYGRNEVNQTTQIIIANAPDAGRSSWNLYNSFVPGRQSELSLSSSVEGRLTTGAMEHRLLVGADYSRIGDWSLMYMDMMPVGSVDLLTPGAWPKWAMPQGLAMTDGDATYTTAGGFAQLQSTLGKLHLLGGLRLAYLGMDSVSINYARSDTLNETRILPRIGAVYDLTDQISAFASYSEGMKANPFTFYAGSPKPEYSRQAEVGVKFDSGTGLSGSLAVFRIERENVPVTNPADPFMLTSIPDGQQMSKGFEADLVWQPSGPWKLIANYAYTRAELTADIPNGAPAGSTLPGVPRHSGGLWLDYDTRTADGEGWRVGGGIHAVSSANIDQMNLYKTAGYATIDASASYTGDRFSVGLFAKNLTDRNYFTPYYRYLDGRAARGEGRKILLNVTKTF